MTCSTGSAARCAGAPFAALRAALAASSIVALALAGCGRHDENQTVGEKVDYAIARADEKADVARVELKRGAEQARAAAGVALVDARQAAGGVVQSAGLALSDSAVTAKIEAGFVADAELKALDIHVETHEGRTTLSGNAPNMAARARAGRLAAEVKGVASLDNRLTIKP